MPYNAEALAMFPDGVFPDLTRVLQLSPTPVKTLQLRATADLFLYKGYMTEEQCQWWHDQLDVFTEQDKEVCEECVRVRMVMKGNPKLMKDSKAEKKRKGRNYRKAYFGLFKHLQDETGHKLFQSMLPFPAVLWNYDADEGYSCVAGPPVELPPLSHIDTQKPAQRAANKAAQPAAGKEASRKAAPPAQGQKRGRRPVARGKENNQDDDEDEEAPLIKKKQNISAPVLAPAAPGPQVRQIATRQHAAATPVSHANTRPKKR